MSHYVRRTTCSSQLVLLATAILLLGHLYLQVIYHNPNVDPGDLSTGTPNGKTVVPTRSKARSLLFMTASYTMDQILPLQRVLDCMRDICNAGWDVTIHIQASPNSINYNHPMYPILQERLYCVRTQAHIPLIIESYGAIGFGLNKMHRQFVVTHIEEYDYFSYAEEDMLLTVSHLHAYIQAQTALQQSLPDSWMRYQIGFLRYEDSIMKGDMHRVTWEYFPHQIHVTQINPFPQQRPNRSSWNSGSHASSRSKENKFIFTNNLNQAIYIFPRRQLLDLEHRCHFLTDTGQNVFYKELRRAQNKEWKYMSVGVSEWSSSFQQILQCGLRRIIPLEHFQLFMIHHGTDKAQKRRLRRELLTMNNWTEIVRQKLYEAESQIMTAGADHSAILSVEEAQGRIMFQQYNLHLMDTELLSAQGVKWQWDWEWKKYL